MAFDIYERAICALYMVELAIPPQVQIWDRSDLSVAQMLANSAACHMDDGGCTVSDDVLRLQGSDRDELERHAAFIEKTLTAFRDATVYLIDIEKIEPDPEPPVKVWVFGRVDQESHGEVFRELYRGTEANCRLFQQGAASARGGYHFSMGPLMPSEA